MAQHRIRADGWTAGRQVAFLAALADSHNVTAAARAAGMSRESAHRLRNRPDGALFAHLWDLALAPTPLRPRESHTTLFTDGQLARLLGNHHRRERADFMAIGAPAAKARAG